MEVHNHLASGGVQTLADTLEKPLLDDRQYRVIKLPNELEALLIHDPTTDKASAALDNNAGAMSDAKDMPGMAHAVEHLLFMGTKKYPQENEYQRYLSAHSGHSNAFTASTSTNYFFEVAAKADKDVKEDGTPQTNGTQTSSPLYGALDRFAQFFVEPLFLEETLDRELRAVDSENKKNLQDDMWRLMQLGRTLSNPKHPNNHFATGNLKTLRDEPVARGVKIRDEFIKFHERQYSANRMKLVVLGRESLDTLQSWVEELFADVVNKKLPQNRWDGIPIYSENELNTEIRVKPVVDMRSINLSFPWMDEDPLFEEQPGRYMSHLIGHEGPGSILAYVKAKGWANSLSAGEHTICPGTATFSIELRLTPEGLKNYKEIVAIIFQYISILREKKPEQWIFDEMKRMTEVDFRFKQKSDASRTASKLSQVMQKPLPRSRLLSGENVITKFDSELIQQALKSLSPENFRLTIVSQDALVGESDIRHEPWYNTEYSVKKMPQDFLSEIRKAYNSKPNERIAELALPAKNEFIPSKLEVEKKEVGQPAKTPKLIRHERNLRLWYKKDDQFWVPKGSMNLLLRNPICGLTARNAVIACLYTELVEDSLAEYAYDAQIAGLGYALDSSSNGLTIHIAGYSDKMSVLLEKVLLSMRDLEVKQDRFDVIKERLMRGWKNSEFAPPYHQVSQYSRWLSQEHGWVTEQLLDELPAISSDDIRSFQSVLLRQLHIEALAHGNIYQEDALKATDVVQSVLKPEVFPAHQWKVRRAIDFPSGSNYVYERTSKDPLQVNHAIHYLLNIGDKTDKLLHAQLLLFCQMTHEPAFNQLRSQEQLGYVVFSGHVTHITQEVYRILIQSERTPQYLESRIEAFLGNFRQVLVDMTDAEFESHKNSVVSERLEKLKNLNEEGNRFWHHISNEVYQFQQREDDVEALKGVKKEHMLEFYDKYINPESTTRAKLAVYLNAQAGEVAAQMSEANNGKEIKTRFLAALEQFLGMQSMPVDKAALTARFQNVDVLNQDAVLGAVSTYLKEDAKLPGEVVAAAINQGKPVLQQALAQVNSSSANNVEKPEQSSQAIKIEDVRAFKASLPLTKGASPVVDLSVFEDLEAKL